MLTGFPANSVFIVDSEDRVRHHTVLDPRFLVMMLCAMLLMLIFLLGLALTSTIPRVGWNLEEVARLVSAFRFVLTYCL